MSFRYAFDGSKVDARHRLRGGLAWHDTEHGTHYLRTIATRIRGHTVTLTLKATPTPPEMKNQSVDTSRSTAPAIKFWPVESVMRPGRMEVVVEGSIAREEGVARASNRTGGEMPAARGYAMPGSREARKRERAVRFVKGENPCEMGG